MARRIVTTEQKPAEEPAADKPRKGKPLMRLTLRLVATVDFRLGLIGHYDFLKSKRLMRDLADDECILLLSQTGRRLAFMFNEVSIDRGRYEPTRAISAYQVALDKSTPWNHKMLSVYAEQARIELVGITKFEEHMAALAKAEEKAAA